MSMTGGCQCGAVRFAVEAVGRASLCHCRMCQKAFGSFFGPFVGGDGLTWTRGEPRRFRSSNHVRRGFCGDCGTPLTYEWDGAAKVELAIGAFDDPAALRPVVQMGLEARLPWFGDLPGLPALPPAEAAASAKALSDVVSYQHPDHDTPADGGPAER